MVRITSEPLPAELGVLYAELVEQLTALDAARSIGHAEGSFVAKTIKGRPYVYFQHAVPGARPRQVYLGPRTRELAALARRFETERAAVASDRKGIERLCAALRAGGAAVTDAASGRVLAALADAAVFRLGGVLVGTQAFIVLGNVLGLRWERGLLRTQDIDIAGERTLAVGVPQVRADVPAALESLRMGFLPVPGLSPREPSTSFKVRGRALRVDLLTPGTGRTSRPVTIGRFGAAATPLRHLDYLLEDAQSAAVIDGGGVLVRVPHPARFALHKLLVAETRAPAWQAKRDKDLLQAAQLIAVLSEDRPGDLARARADLTRRGSSWERALARGLRLLARVDAGAAALVESARA